MRRLLCLLLAVVLCVSLLPAALAWDTDAAWSDAYETFILNEGFRETGRDYSDSAEYPVCFTLYDLDGDLTPEMFLRDPLRAMVYEPYDVYAFRSGRVVYIGRVGIRSRALHYAPGVGYPGAFSYDGPLNYYTGWYYTMEGGSIVTQRVVETEGKSGQLIDTWVTADEGLKMAFQSAYDGPVTSYSSFGALPAFSRDEIDAMGWETFAGGSGGAALFYDVPVTEYYAHAVAWAGERGITTGTEPAYFSPDGYCTRAQAVTFLWRLSGEPAPTETSPFRDVPQTAYYAEAVAWAVEQGVTDGTSDTTFSPNDFVTRGQAVTLLWRLRGSPAITGDAAFVDVPLGRYDAPAVRWAAALGITNGTGGGRFSPDRACTRCQIVTFLCRCAVKVPGVLRTEDLTARYLEEGEPFQAEKTYTDEGAETAVLLIAARELQDTALLRVDVSTGEMLVTGEPLWLGGDLPAGTTLCLETIFPDVGPHIALRYTANGTTVTLGLAQSGRDGSLILTPMN